MLPAAGRACPNLLIGDSIAQGMAAYARADGYQVIARRGAGLVWARRLAPRCVDTLVLVLGTNELPGMSERAARRYASRVAELVGAWQPRRAVWVLPGCYLARPDMERASAWMDEAAEPTEDLGLSRGRPVRCDVAGGDGIHPSASGYRRWWRDLRPSEGLWTVGPGMRSASDFSGLQGGLAQPML